MRELQEILKKIETLDRNEKAVIATVVDVQGSSYRLPGAKMLILGSGETFGTVSGGCLEADVMERARQVLDSDRSQLFTYDTASTEDSIFSLNMGCRGVIRILLEPLSHEYVEKLKDKFAHHDEFLSVVIIAADDREHFPVGKRYYFNEEGRLVNSSEQGPTDPRLPGIERVLENKRAGSHTIEIAARGIEFFFECLKPPLSLIIFGAGADAIPLADIAKNVGWNVSIVDHRPAFAAPERFPRADNIFLSRPEELNGNLGIDENTVAVVMSHNYENDKYVLDYLLNSPARYIGALGPKKRTQELLAKLTDGDKKFNSGQLNRLFAPVGLDIGATTPEGIALSIIAEIQSFLSGRSGGFLRDRNGSIYDRST
jgi:xanthine/CO dehydrogenase XdhC/CoxF family maturation factor